MAKVPGKGTLLKHGVGTGPTVYTTIVQRMSIDGPDAKVETQKTTDLDSVAAEYRPTMPDGGELSMSLWWDPATATHQLLTDLITTPAVEHWEIVYADTGASLTIFDGILTGFKPGGMDPDGYLTAEIKIQVTGAITWP